MPNPKRRHSKRRTSTRRAHDFLSKPVNKEALIKRVQLMLKLRNVTDELERLRRYIEEMEEAR